MQEQRKSQTLASIRVIIADDSPSFRRGIRTFLDELPACTIVGETDNAEDVLRICEQSHPDLILLDLSLSRYDGTALMHILHERYQKLKQVVFVSPHDEAGLIACAKCGVSGCISKNADPDLIRKAVQSVATGERWLQPEMVEMMFAGLHRALCDAPEHTQATLSKREIEVFHYLAQGMRNKEIAQQLFISERTVKVHVANIFDKLGVRGRVEAVRYAIYHGLVHD